MNNCAIRLPSEDDKWLEFKNHTNKERLPFIVYADLECVLRRTEPTEREDASYTYQQHEVFSILRAMLVRRVIGISISSRRKLCCVVRSATRRFGASSKNSVIRECPHGNVVERAVGGIS
ncbi:hypothetical protein P5V15_007091 [Pogonomyrmex californicus]